PTRRPDVWFSEAAESGLGVELELAAIQRGIGVLDALPEDTHVSVNASPCAVLSSGLSEVFRQVPLHRVLLELTEHAHVEDYDALIDALEPLRRRGLRVAVDDAGAGYSNLKHILHLRPDFIKLDM